MMEREGTVEEKGGKKGKRVRSLSNCNVSDWEIRNPRGGRWSQAEHERFLAGKVWVEVRKKRMKIL